MIVDKSKWPRGPWDDEPDILRWTDEATKYPCIMVRNPMLGNWCGYVAVPPGHPLCGVGYEDVPDDINGAAHGGLTFAGPCHQAREVCHVPEPGEPDGVWWFGFDCAHYDDALPSMMQGDLVHLFGITGARYKTAVYVKHSTQELARALFCAKPIK